MSDQYITLGVSGCDVDTFSEVLSKLLNLSFERRHSSYIGKYCKYSDKDISIQVRPNREVDGGEVYLRLEKNPEIDVVIILKGLSHISNTVVKILSIEGVKVY